MSLFPLDDAEPAPPRAVVLGRPARPQELDRLRALLVRPVPAFPGELTWPASGGDLTQVVPADCRTLAELPDALKPSAALGWRVALVRDLARAVDAVASAGLRLNALGLAGVLVRVVRESEVELGPARAGVPTFAGLCVPLTLSDADPAEAGSFAVPDGWYAAPEVRGTTHFPVERPADVYLAAALAYRLLGGPDGVGMIGPAVRTCLDDALGDSPPRRPETAGQFVEELSTAVLQDLSRGGPQVSLSLASDLGLGGREQNEDACAAWKQIETDVSGYRSLGVAAVSDGMGGAAMGERASMYAVTRVVAEFRHGLPLLLPGLGDGPALLECLRNWVNLINEGVLRMGDRLGCPDDTGATLTALVWVGRVAAYAHAGDSRLLRLRGGRLDAFTQDQTYAAELIKQGVFTPEQARLSPLKNVLVSHLGTPLCAPQVGLIDLNPGDRLLLASDGLLEGFADDAELAELLAALPVAQAAEGLIAAAKENIRRRAVVTDTGLTIRPESDNMTAVVVHVGG